MRRKHWTAEEKLKAIQYIDSSNSVTKACRELGIDPSMYYRWKKTYQEKGKEGLEPKYSGKNPELEKLKRENEMLKKLLAEKTLEMELLQEFLKKTTNNRRK
jgi:putative transposase